MCLVIAGGTNLQEAKEDIIIYKILMMHNESYYTPFRKQYVNLGHKQVSPLVCHTNSVSLGIHTFANLEEAKYESLDPWYLYDYVIVKGIIPKGSHYYEGYFDEAYLERRPLCYASDAAIYQERVL
jgi:hypothetical protein